MIYVECKPDVALVNALGIPKREIIHAGNKSKVCKRLSKSENSKGLIDQDPWSDQLSYVKRLETVYNQHGVEIREDRQNKNRLIILCPRLEEWILEATKEANLDITEYGLPNSGKKLHGMINTNISKFETLIEELLRRNSNMLNVLRRALKGG